MKSINLIIAIQLLSVRGMNPIAIEFEDGSGYKFNFTTIDGEKGYVDLTTEIKAMEEVQRITSKF